MNRRDVVIGLAGLIAGGGALVGTGAFDTVEAERSVAVETAGDADAFLGIEPFPGSPNSDYVDASGDTIVIDITETGTDAPGAGVNENAVTAIDRLLMVTNNGTQDAFVGFSDQYAIDEGDYTEAETPGGWGYAVADDESAAVVLWASPLPSTIDKSLGEEVRPDLTTTGFDGSTLVDGRNDDEVEEKAEREIGPGESVHIGAIVDTRESTVEDNSLPDELDDTVRLFADTTDD